jgi:HlyD family secretion protein
MIHQIWTQHRKKSLAIMAMALIAAWYGFKSVTTPPAQTLYVLAQVTKGTLISSVSGSGQVSSSNQVDIKSKASGEILKVGVKVGQEVKAGDTIAHLDSSDAQKTLRDAEVSLQTAQLSHEKLLEPASGLTLLQAQNSLKSAQIGLEKLKLTQEINLQKAEQAQKKAEDDIAKAYEDALNTASNAYQVLPTIMTGLDNILNSDDIATGENSVGDNQYNNIALLNSLDYSDRDDFSVYLESASKDYAQTRLAYDAAFLEYKSVTRYADRPTIESLIKKTYETARSIAQTAKSVSNMLDKWVDLRSKRSWTIFATVKTYQSNVSTYNSQIGSNLSSLLSSQSSLQSNLDNLTNSEIDLREMKQNYPLDLQSSEANLKEKRASLNNLIEGPDNLDIRSSELTIRQRQYTLADAREKLADYTVRAPFDGTIAVIDLKTGDSLSSGGIAATLIARQRIAEISLNEVDAAKIKVGQKVTLTFDAIDGLGITGEISEVDALGAVSQGVVTYGAKIGFDTQDERIKPGMSVSANIITEAKQDVLIAPNAAVKTQGPESYVDIPNETIPASAIKAGNGGNALGSAPSQKTVTIGLSNDTSTEIVEGLNEGDVIVIRTATPSTAKAATGTSLFQMPRGSGGLR